MSETVRLHTYDCTDKEDVPSGTITFCNANAKINPEHLPNNTFDHLIVCPVIGNFVVDEEKILSKQKEFNEAIQQYSKMPPSLDVRNIETNLDGEYWTPEFGENDASFAGLFKQTNGRDTKYNIVVQAGCPLICGELREKFYNATYDQLLKDKLYGFAGHIGMRNTQRLAYNVARVLGVPISHALDRSAINSDIIYESEPWIALPTHVQKVSCIVRAKDDASRVGIYNKVTPALNVNARHFIYEGPYNGIAEYAVAQNTIKHGLPTHSGKHESPKSVLKQHIDKRCTGVVCERINTKEHHEIHKDVYKSTKDASFKMEMKKLGWQADTMVPNMVPVLVKIFDPTLKR
jgi:hypothetical protein